MSTQHGGRVKACRDRCEVCDVVLTSRPVKNRRRCLEHLDQLALVPVTALRRPGRLNTNSSKSDTSRGSDR